MSKPKAKRPIQTDAFPGITGTKRVTYTVPAATADRISRLSHRMGVSQSAFVSELLQEPIAVMASIIDALPETGATPADVRRAKGRSVALIKSVLQEAQSVVEEFRSARPQRNR